MIVALRIKTGGLGCRAYVDGYCGRAALVVSGVAAGAAGAGAEARRLPPADAHALASASSRDNNDRMLVSSLVPELLDELDYEGLSHEFGLEQTSGRIGAHVHRKRHARAGHVDAESLERTGRDGHGLRSTDLEREQFDGILARREEGHREGLAGSERQRRYDERDGVLVHRARREHRIDLEALHRAVRLRRRARPF